MNLEFNVPSAYRSYCQIDISVICYMTSFPWDYNSIKFSFNFFLCFGRRVRGCLECMNRNIGKIIQIPNLKLLPTSKMLGGRYLANLNISWQKRSDDTFSIIEHKIQPQTQDWERSDVISVDGDDTVTLLRHICMERCRTFSLADGHCMLQDVQRCAITNCHTGVTTEITVLCLRVCKWQCSFTFRSAGKTDCGNGNWSFLKHCNPRERNTDVTFA